MKPDETARAADRDDESPAPLPDCAVGRLIRYRKYCERMARTGGPYTNSSEIGGKLGVGPSLVRKDLSHFGRLGIRGTGYDMKHLAERLTSLLGGGREWNLALVGVGNFGAALLGDEGLREGGFRFVAAFDTDPAKIGTERGGTVIRHPSDFGQVIGGTRVDIGVITVPAVSAQEAAALLARMHVRAILNLAPTELSPIENLFVANLDLSLEMEKLTCELMMAKSAVAQAEARSA
ncbi:MAG: redox-sensing transcriptional repressor Rex [Planctomycetota bacterium]|jgi:redox-sensing transcriptional repressor